MPLPVIAGAAGILPVVFTYGVGLIIFKVITGLGLGLVSYVGFSAVFQEINDYLLVTLSGAPASVVQILEICNVPQAINIIFSAYLARFTVGAVVRRMTVGNP